MRGRSTCIHGRRFPNTLGGGGGRCLEDGTTRPVAGDSTFTRLHGRHLRRPAHKTKAVASNFASTGTMRSRPAWGL
eukprot:11209519-Lingulodinium_polyedra.AAC.1